MSKRGDELRRLIKEVPPPKEVKAIFDNLLKESDRSAALVGAALLETVLERLIKHSLHTKSSEIHNQLFEQRGPLGDLFSKITVASAFGVISSTLASELRIVRNVRNVFAHATTGLSFNTPEIAKEIGRSLMLAAMRDVDKEIKPLRQVEYSPREQFKLLVHITFTIMDFEQRKKGGMALSD